MPNIEVIDLLSSPPGVRIGGNTAGRSAETAQGRSAALAAAASATPSVIENRMGTRTGYLFSDPFASSPIIERDLKQRDYGTGRDIIEREKSPQLPAPRNSTTALISSKRIGKEKELVQELDSEGFVEISSDLVEVTKSAQTTTGNIGSLGGGNAAAAISKNGSKDCIFFDDDFSSTVDLDASYTLPGEPAMKKRRVSSDIEEFPARTSVKVGNTRTDAGKLSNLKSGENKGLKRAASDVARSSNAASANTKEKENRIGSLKRSKTSIYDEDPIVFTSSPDIVKAAREKREKARRERGKEIDLEDDLYGNIERDRRKQSANGPDPYSLSSDADLPEVSGLVDYASQNPLPRSVKEKEKAKISSTKSSKPTKSADVRVLDKARAAAQKAAEKEAEKERKRILREDKARDKQNAADLAKVNTLRIDKKVSTPEMIVDLPADLDEKLVKQVKSFLSPLQVDVNDWASTIPNVIKWRRKVEARYNEEMGHWEPTAKHVKEEKHVLCAMRAQEFVDLSMGSEGSDLDAHVLRMKANFDGCEVIYLIEGLTPWMKKNKNIRNRQFTEAVRSQIEDVENVGTTPSQPKRKRKEKEKPEYVDEDGIEDSLLKLQVVHGALIHHTSAMVDTAQWVVAFTQHISTVPYRHQRMTLDTAFCMETGQVRTGDDAADTFVKMLQEVNRITAPIAYGIAAEYPSVQKLIRGFEEDRDGGKDLLTHLRKSANRDGAVTEREVGKRISRRVWGIFMGREEGSTDV